MIISDYSNSSGFMSDRLRFAFFTLLRMGLWGKGKLGLICPLNSDEWFTIYKYACNHTVEGVLYDSFSLLNEEELPPNDLRVKWAVKVDQIERFNIKINAVIADLYVYFEQLGVNAILLKGQSVASCYEAPLHRVSGDIDWFLEKEDYQIVLDDLKKRHHIQYPLESFSCDWNGVHVDFHMRLFDISSPFKNSYLRKTRIEYQTRQQSININGQKVFFLSPELQLFQVNVHILKHLLFLGIGLRQFCDAARLYYAYHDKLNPVLLEKIYKDVGMLEWMNVLHTILVNYIGLPKENLPFRLPLNSNVEDILNDIWNSGNFGSHDTRFSMKSRGPNFLERYYRSWQGFKRYFSYVPEEVFFFTFRRIRAGLLAIFSKE